MTNLTGEELENLVMDLKARVEKLEGVSVAETSDTETSTEGDSH